MPALQGVWQRWISPLLVRRRFTWPKTTLAFVHKYHDHVAVGPKIHTPPPPGGARPGTGGGRYFAAARGITSFSSSKAVPSRRSNLCLTPVGRNPARR